MYAGVYGRGWGRGHGGRKRKERGVLSCYGSRSTILAGVSRGGKGGVGVRKGEKERKGRGQGLHCKRKKNCIFIEIF